MGGASTPSWRSNSAIIAAIGAVLVVLGLLVLGRVDHAGAEMAKVDALQVSVGELEKAFDGNEVAAMQKYGGRLLAITGVVTKVALGVDDEPFISFESSGLIPFQAKFSSADKSGLSAISEGQSITVYCGDITETLGQPFGGDCFL